MKSTTPKKVSGAIKRFLNDAGLDGRPSYLEFTETAPEYWAKYCLDNCEAERLKTGCEIIYGWMIWQDKKESFIEAEFHAIVKTDGKFVDITPRVDGERKILFVEDLAKIPERIDAHTWRSWDNIKSKNGVIYEESQVIVLKDAGFTINEKRSIDDFV